MDAFGYLLQGFSVAATPANLGYVFLGCVLGTVIGVLPGIGPAAAIALLLPITYGVEPTSALIMLAGIYYGAMYGGSTTSILINTPGESSSVMTALDGYRMARNGRAGAALAVSAIASFVAGTVSVILLTLLAKPLAAFALRFGPALAAARPALVVPRADARHRRHRPAERAATLHVQPAGTAGRDRFRGRRGRPVRARRGVQRPGGPAARPPRGGPPVRLAVAHPG
jgi:hypothetical protein